MRIHHGMLKRITQFGLLLMMGASMGATAGLLGLVGDSWKEETLQHDGSKIVVERSQSYFFQALERWARVKEHSITFTPPGSNKAITWTSEYSEDISTTNFNLVALHVLKGAPYIVASPNLCLSYNKWGRPNPPYVIFKYDGKVWQRIQLAELPAEANEINLLIQTVGSNDPEQAIKTGFISADSIQTLNSNLRQPEYKTILREALPQARINEMCMEMVPYKGSWVMPNDPIARKFIDNQKR
ncbi:MAG: hypothetical protein HY306_00205 [Nitrosomonadales bacterium]|nr:hypothetical protein [Nitrosomonadales bacterium]